MESGEERMETEKGSEGTMTAAEARIVDGTAWRDFSRALERAGDAILQPGTPATVFDRAEGLRYLTRLLRAGLDSHAKVEIVE